jgi:hypothetical protein
MSSNLTILIYLIKNQAQGIVSVARVRRRGDRPTTLNHQVWYVYLGKYGKTRNSCLLSVEKNEMGVAT